MIDKRSALTILKSGVKEWNAWLKYEKADNEFPLDLSNADLRWVALSGVDLSGVQMNSARMGNSDFCNSKFQNAILKEANFFATDLVGANFHKADLQYADFSYADLTNCNLVDANLRNANFQGAVLSEADLSYANLEGARLKEAILVDADLTESNLQSANLRGCKLERAYMFRTKFINTIVDGADFANGIFGRTLLVDVNLSQADGLEFVEHVNVSDISIGTIYRSQGNIPEKFLKESGVPVKLMEFMKAIDDNEIDYYSVFLSHSSEDDEFVRKLFDDLEEKGIKTFYAPEHLKAGQKLFEQIDLAIKNFDKILLVISEASMKSQWVDTEIWKTIEYEQEHGKRKLFPISIGSFEEIKNWKAFNADAGKDMARELREYYIPTDFSNWKDHDSYQKAFDKLVQDLRADETPTA